MARCSIILYFLCVLITIATFPAILPAEFFKYADETGKSHYVDDISKIPPQYRNQIKSYEEEKDSLSFAEKAALQAEKQREKNLRQWRRQQTLEMQRQKYKDQQQAQAQALAGKKSKPKSQRGSTDVFIGNGQVQVPVQFRYKGKRVDATLLLDTGANKTLVSKRIGDALGLDTGNLVGIQVVGGAVIPGRHVLVDEMIVGPNKKKDMSIIVLEKGGVGGQDGLLGMDFLMGIKFHVDYERERIVWSG